jgi:hypothetical protein
MPVPRQRPLAALILKWLGNGHGANFILKQTLLRVPAKPFFRIKLYHNPFCFHQGCWFDDDWIGGGCFCVGGGWLVFGNTGLLKLAGGYVGGIGCDCIGKYLM